MIANILEEIGLNKNETIIYLSLLKTWTSFVWNIIKSSWLPRATTYDSLERLYKKSIIVKSSKSWNTVYTAEPPEVLRFLLEKKRDEIEMLESNLDKIMPELKWMHNPYSILPDIKFYEWLDWIQKVLSDSLKSKEIIYTYTNVDWMIEHIKEINEDYLEKRKKYKVRKKWLIVDTPYAREFVPKYDKTVTQSRILKSSVNFDLEMEIYDWKISYLTFTNDKPVWVIIENNEIYQMHRSLFELNWAISEEV